MPKVLIVEDNSDLREFLRDRLEEDGFEVIAVGDGADALDCLTHSAVDLILLDIIMPQARIDGVAFLSQLTSHPELNETPVAILSAVGDIVKEALRPAIAQALRIRAVIAKPFDPGDLLRTVRDIVTPR